VFHALTGYGHKQYLTGPAKMPRDKFAWTFTFASMIEILGCHREYPNSEMMHRAATLENHAVARKLSLAENKAKFSELLLVKQSAQRRRMGRCVAAPPGQRPQC
jgi:hypothetical protein